MLWAFYLAITATEDTSLISRGCSIMACGGRGGRGGFFGLGGNGGRGAAQLAEIMSIASNAGAIFFINIFLVGLMLFLLSRCKRFGGLCAVLFLRLARRYLAGRRFMCNYTTCCQYASEEQQ